MQIKDLTANPKNPRKISDEKLSQLEKSLKEFGSLDGFIFNTKTKRLVGGHQRQKIFNKAKVLKFKGTNYGYVEWNDERFPYREVSWSETKEKAANIAANKGAGEWDQDILGEWFQELSASRFDLDLTMFDLEERSKYLPEESKEGLCGDDEVPVDRKTSIVPGDLFSLGNHRLLCGDSTSKKAVEKLMNGEKVDMVFTSPPYLDLRDYGGGLDLSVEKLCGIFDWPSSLFCVNLGLIIKDREIVQYWNDWLAGAKSRGHNLLSWNVWDKGNASSVGHQQAMFGLSHEWVFVLGEYRKLNLTKRNKLAGGGSWSDVSQRQKDGSLVRKNAIEVSDYRQLDTIFNLQSLRNFSDEYTGHPAAFPSELPKEYVEACTSVGDIVGEPFLGSGSTLIACEKTNRKCYGMEIDPQYCQVIIDRWEKFTGKRAKLINSRKTAHAKTKIS